MGQLRLDKVMRNDAMPMNNGLPQRKPYGTVDVSFVMTRFVKEKATGGSIQAQLANRSCNDITVIGVVRMTDMASTAIRAAATVVIQGTPD